MVRAAQSCGNEMIQIASACCDDDAAIRALVIEVIIYATPLLRLRVGIDEQTKTTTHEIFDLGGRELHFLN